jgi:indole-3-glycerol phosphate synthase
VEEKVLKRLVEYCFSLGVEPVVEIFHESEISFAVRSEARIVAVNARDLDTFEVDLAAARRVMRVIPDSVFQLAFSGLRYGRDILEAKQCGADGVLVGTAMLRSDDPEGLLQDILSLNSLSSPSQRLPRSDGYVLPRNDKDL